MANKQTTLSTEQRVLAFIKANNLIKSGRKLVVAVSGGPDSVCLLHILFQLRGELHVELHAAHLNHQLRGEESDADAEFVADLAVRLNIPASIESSDVTAYREKHRLSTEEAAREVRYAFLSKVARDIGTDRIAVGHTADDQAETVLMHLIRGAGTRGLRGLQPESRRQSGRNTIAIIRPLLAIRRSETVEYCRLHNLNPRRDSSNASLVPLRNRIRHELLPLLRQYNPGIDAALLRTASIAGDDLSFIDIEADKLGKAISKKENDTFIFERKAFGALLPALQRHLLRISAESLLGNIRDVEAAHIEEIIGILEKPAGKRVILPVGLTFIVERERYLLGKDPATLSPYPLLGEETRLNIPGETVISGWRITSTVTSAPSKIDVPDEFTARFDYDAAGDVLSARKRRPGDRFQPLGMSRTKKLNRFMIDSGIPQSWRSRIPLVCSGDDIIWVVGQRIDDRFKVTGNTRRYLYLAFERL